MRFHKALFVLVFFAACGIKENSPKATKTYFDIQGYFEKEASRLQQKNPLVEKSVSQNNQSEKKDIKIVDWKNELELFRESDINKPAWKDSYQHIKKGFITELISTDKKLKTQKITILRDKSEKITGISILNRVSNSLYTTSEELNYFPDSLYSIIKDQDVRFIGKNRYIISAKFKTIIQ